MTPRRRRPLPARALRRSCRRALFAAARRQGRGPRALLRRAVRDYLRRHRGDAAHLAWALRSVTRNAALALPLLGLAAAARAEFVQRPQDENPFHSISIEVLTLDGSLGTPVLVDLDGDGDLDAVSGEDPGTFPYFENTGSSASPAFVERTGSRSPLDGLDVGDHSAPAFVDIDGDGDLDLFSGSYGGGGFVSYFENTGSSTSPAFLARTGSANPLHGLGSPRFPAFVDVDADGDFDAFGGFRYLCCSYFENTGSATSPAFVSRSGSANPLADHADLFAPTFADLDADGDPDAVIGRYGGAAYFENVSLPLLPPVFLERPGPLNPFEAPLSGSGGPHALALADLDADGDLDAAVGSFGRHGITFLENTGLPILAAFTERTGLANPLGRFYDFSLPGLVDIDGDGDLDAFAFHQTPDFPIVYFENTGAAGDFSFAQRTGTANPVDGLPGFGFVDIDGDDDLDIVTSASDATFRYFENTGSATGAAFVERTGSANPLDGLDVGDFYSFPVFVDIDGDGDPDLFSGSTTGDLFHFENTGSATDPAFAERTGSANPLDGFGASSLAVVSFADLDRDGDSDGILFVLTGSDYRFLENTGSGTSPAFALRTGAANPLDPFLGFGSGLSLQDVDGDGDPDLFVRPSDRNTVYYENVHPALVPVPPWAALLSGLGIAAWARRLRARAGPRATGGVPRAGQESAARRR